MPFPRLPLAVAAATWAACAFADTPGASERLEASYLLALGRPPTSTEVRDWAPRAEGPMAGLFARHRERLDSSADERLAVATRAWRDAFGIAPGTSDAAALSASEGTYVEQVERLRQRLAEGGEPYRQVIDRAYRRVLGRGPFAEEIGYWGQSAPLPFGVLVGCLESWARRNAPGLTVTSGTPAICVTSDILTTRRLSPAVAAEARAATGLPAAGDPALALARGQNVLMPGAGAVVSVGGVHFVAAGGMGPEAE